MKFLDHIRRVRSNDNNDHLPPRQQHDLDNSRSRHAADQTAQLPAALLETLLSYVCSRDDNYNSCEDSSVNDGCMLCDLKDLSRCALVSKRWCEAAQNALYHHIRIDAVHYCDRESELATKGQTKSFNNRNGRHANPPQERLQLLARTVRDNGSLANKVQYLKTPYMTRESSIADLARTVSFIPNVLYVDLPDGIHTDAVCDTLRQEVQSRCPRLRYMKYNAGSDSSFRMLAHFYQWRELEVLELSNLAVEPDAIKEVFVSLPALREVKLADLPLLDDSVFAPVPSTEVPLRPLARLTLQNAPNISVAGLVVYLSQPGPQNPLTYLTLINTGVLPSDLHQILASAPSLLSLYSAITISQPFPSLQIPPLASKSLRSLHYEITNTHTSNHGLASLSEGYYAYLSSSIHFGMLPSLTHLYTLSVTPQDLLQPAVQTALSARRPGNVATPLSLGLRRPLRLFTKPISELEWNVTLVTPPSLTHSRGDPTSIGPESLQCTMPLSPQYKKQGRQSLIVGNGFGGFLAVPSPGFAPDGSEWKNQRKEADAWMG